MKRGFLILVILVALVPMAHANGWATVVSSFSTSGWTNNPACVTTDGTDLWITDDLNGKIFKVTTSGSLISSLDISSIVYPTGVAWDGSSLWTHSSVGSSNSIYHINSTSGSIIGSFPGVVTYGYPYDMEYLTGNLWCVSLSSSDRKAYCHSASNGAILTSFPTQAKYPSGICYDGTNFLITGNTDGLTYRYTTTGTLIDHVANTPFTAASYSGGTVWLNGHMFQVCNIQKMVYEISIDWGPHETVEPISLGVLRSIYE